MHALFTNISEASFSSSGLYRWSLSRRLNNNIRTIIFIGLNPSKASASRNDPTLRRLIYFSSSWGYGNLIVVNLFARVCSSSSFIRRCTDPIGKRNDQELLFRISEWSQNLSFDLWVGWGNQGTWRNRNLQIMELLKKNAIQRASKFPSSRGPLSLGLTKNGHPRHPLYISNKNCLKSFYLK